MTFRLRSVIRGHESDVRAVYPALHPEGAVLTASRDQTCRLWVPSDEAGSFTEGHIFSGHTRYISAVTTIPPSEEYPHGLVATGGHDSLILVFSLESTEPVQKLEGHTDAVISIVSGKFGTLLSGSWDKTAKVWVNGQCVMNLKDHAAAIWAVEMMPDQGYMLTGSADKTIKLWKAGTVERTLTGHTDCVRGLAVLSSFEFLSCSNDCDVRRWSTTGDCLQIYTGHTNFIYSIASLHSGSEDFATCGEDRSLRIWKGGCCVQLITMPCTSVWSVCCLSNGDIVVGSSDGVARIFTSEVDRIAPPDVIKAFEEEVANQAIPAASNLDLGEIDKDELSGPEALLTPGVKDGQTKLIKRGSNVEAHQWDASEQLWKKIGDVVGAAGADGTAKVSNKTVYNGKEYDYVFDVDVEEGKPPLKLPFNVTDDPWMAAQKFLDSNDLSPVFLDQVVQFILQNSKNAKVAEATPQFSDPFTGGSRYIPGSSTQSDDPQLNVFQDPFTGGNRYIPTGQSSKLTENQSSLHDPFTGQSRYTPAGSQKVVPADHVSYFPKTGYLSFDSAKPVAIVTKLKEFNARVDEATKLTEDEVAVLSRSLEVVSEQKSIEEDQCQLLLQIVDKLLKWPVELIFPGLDSVRILVRQKHVNEKLLSQDISSKFIDSVLQVARPDHPPSNLMLVQRILCNCFSSTTAIHQMLENQTKVVEHAVASFSSSNKNSHVASSSTILNYCVALRSSAFEDKVPLLHAVMEALQIGLDGESQFRLLVSLGTLINEDAVSMSFASSVGLKSILENLKSVKDPKKVGDCALQLLSIT